MASGRFANANDQGKQREWSEISPRPDSDMGGIQGRCQNLRIAAVSQYQEAAAAEETSHLSWDHPAAHTHCTDICSEASRYLVRSVEGVGPSPSPGRYGCNNVVVLNNSLGRSHSWRDPSIPLAAPPSPADNTQPIHLSTHPPIHPSTHIPLPPAPRQQATSPQT
ncbi:hypothetical protein PMIN01_13636 [Paraphaeosphaeria minitans]|uniref:Uncharacterized protein n=1 Tax=Paraphaeosphaeria minitans TaxID=565426 RepID=A0A9P6G4N3_9PLEO|nr:hypothetical protein PMIN01_13636 [Paraphaeosphaeria minitans]